MLFPDFDTPAEAIYQYENKRKYAATKRNERKVSIKRMPEIVRYEIVIRYINENRNRLENKRNINQLAQICNQYLETSVQ